MKKTILHPVKSLLFNRVISAACAMFLLPSLWEGPGMGLFAQLSGWQYITPVTVYENSGGSLTDYRALLTFDTQTPIAAGKMKTDGSDIRFAEDDDGVLLLDYWIESGINTTGTKVWVKSPFIPASDSVVIYLFYGNPLAIAVSSITSIFYNGLQALYTFTEGTGSTLYDRLGNYDLPLTGLTWQTGFRNDVYSLTGWTGGGRSFIGSNGPVLGTGDFTVFAFIRPLTPNGSTQGIVGNYFDDSNNGWVVKLQGGAGEFMLLTNEAGNWCQLNSGTLSASTWAQVGAKRNSGISDYMYQNGNNILTLCPADNRNLNNSGPFEIGRSYNNQYPFDGNISFVAVYNTALTDAVIDSLYEDIFVSPEPTWSIGAERTMTLAVTNSTTICTGDSVALTVTVTDSTGFPAPYTFLWSPADSLSCTACQSPVANPDSTTTYMVMVTDSAGTQDSAFVTITVLSFPPVADAGTDTAICEGDTVQLNATGGAYYSWSPATGLSDTGIANPYANPAMTTAYQVTVSNGCLSDIDSVTVTVNPAPNVDAGVDTSFCFGGSVGLEAFGATSFVWTPSVGLTCTPPCPKPTASPSSTTTYYVTGTDANGCSDTDSIKITVNGAPVAATSSADSICQGDSAQLEVVAGGAGMQDDFDPGIDFPLWNTINGGAATTDCGSVSGFALYFNGANPPGRSAITQNLNVLTGGTVDFYLKIGSGASPCETADPGEDIVLEYSIDNGITWNIINTYFTGGYVTFTAISENIPAGAQTASTQFGWRQVSFSGSCCDHWAIDDVSISTTGGALDSTAIISWSPSTGLSNPNIANPVASPSATTTYVVTVGDSSCSKTDSITVTVDNTILVLTPSSDVGICTGDSVQLYATSNNPIASWSWSPADGLSDTTIANPVANPSFTTTYTVTATNALGCQIFKDVTVSVAPYPVASFTHSDSVLTVAFTDSSVNAGTWVWEFGDGITSGLLNPTYTYADTGTYNACLIVTNACTSDTLCENITVTDCQFPLALFGYSVSGLTADFTDLSLNATGWSWDFGDASAINTNKNPTHTYADTGTYNVCLTVTSACGTNNKCNAVSITSATGIAENYLENGVNIYPNPNSGEFMLEIYDLRFLNYDLKIYDVFGREILKSQIINHKSKIDLSGHPAGIYNVQLLSDKKMINKKIIIE